MRRAIRYLLRNESADRLHPGRITSVGLTNGSPLEEPSSRETLGRITPLLLRGPAAFALVASANAGSLLLTRAAAPRQEIAMRVALGGGKWRLARMLLSETLLLTFVAGTVSVYLAYRLPAVLGRWLTNAWGETGSTWYSLTPDWRLFGYLALTAIFTGTAAGTAPIPVALRGKRLFGMMNGTQVALSLVLPALA